MSYGSLVWRNLLGEKRLLTYRGSLPSGYSNLSSVVHLNDAILLIDSSNNTLLQCEAGELISDYLWESRKFT